MGSDAFAVRLVGCMTSPEHAEQLQALVACLVHEDRAATDKWAHRLRIGVRCCSASSVPMFVRAVRALVHVDDSLQPERADAVLCAFAEAVEAGKDCYEVRAPYGGAALARASPSPCGAQETMALLAELCQLVRADADVMRWVRGHVDKLEWAQAWLAENPKEPEGNRGAVRRFRPASETKSGLGGAEGALFLTSTSFSSSSSGGVGSASAAAAAASHSKLVRDVAALVSGEELKKDTFDADDGATAPLVGACCALAHP